MRIFGGHTGEPAGRRRPLPSDSDTAARPRAAFSYYSQRSAEGGNTGRRDPDSSLRTASTSGPRRRWTAALTGLIVIAAAIYCLPLSTTPHISLPADAASAHLLQAPSVYQQAASASLGGSLTNRSKLTLNAAAVRLDLLRRYPELKDVQVSVPLIGHTPQIRLIPYLPAFILTTPDDTAFLVDESGRALAPISQIADIDRINVPTLQDQGNVAARPGAKALSGTTVAFTQTVTRALGAKGITVSRLVLPPAAFELDVYLSGSPYFVKFNLQGDALQQAGTFLAAHERLGREHTTPAQYVDVRVPERAYYK